MIEYGLRIAAQRTGEVQENGVRVLREVFDSRTYNDPPLTADPTNLPALQRVSDERRDQRITDGLGKLLVRAQEMGPIKRGLVFALLTLPAYEGEEQEQRRKAAIQEILTTNRILRSLKEQGFIDKDPDPQA